VLLSNEHIFLAFAPVGPAHVHAAHARS
jgi:hypothetical protein